MLETCKNAFHKCFDLAQMLWIFHKCKCFEHCTNALCLAKILWALHKYFKPCTNILSHAQMFWNLHKGFEPHKKMLTFTFTLHKLFKPCKKCLAQSFEPCTNSFSLVQIALHRLPCINCLSQITLHKLSCTNCLAQIALHKHLAKIALRLHKHLAEIALQKWNLKKSYSWAHQVHNQTNWLNIFLRNGQLSVSNCKSVASFYVIRISFVGRVSCVEN